MPAVLFSLTLTLLSVALPALGVSRTAAWWMTGTAAALTLVLVGHWLLCRYEIQRRRPVDDPQLPFRDDRRDLADDLNAFALRCRTRSSLTKSVHLTGTVASSRPTTCGPGWTTLTPDSRHSCDICSSRGPPGPTQRAPSAARTPADTIASARVATATSSRPVSAISDCPSRAAAASSSLSSDGVPRLVATVGGACVLCVCDLVLALSSVGLRRTRSALAE